MTTAMVKAAAFVAMTLCFGGVSYSQQATPSQTDGVRPGDRYVFEFKDDVTDVVRERRTIAVTEVTAKDVATRLTNSTNPNFNGSMVMDRSWNVLTTGPRKYTPNDGTGVQLPLKVGQTWKVTLDDVNAANGATFKRTVTSRVVGQESITTPVGTFDTFVIERQMITTNPKAPGMKGTAESKLWFNANGNFPIKRTFAARRDGRLVEQNTLTLVEYTRKPVADSAQKSAQ